MEDVLDLYAEPYDELRPLVNFDEKNKQLVAEKRIAIPAGQDGWRAIITSIGATAWRTCSPYAKPVRAGGTSP